MDSPETCHHNFDPPRREDSQRAFYIKISQVSKTPPLSLSIVESTLLLREFIEEKL